MSRTERWMEWGAKNKYSIVAGSWAVSIAVAFALVRRNRYLSGQQKIVHARMYAQGLTLAVMVATLAFETSDRTQGTVTPEDVRKDQWKGQLTFDISRCVSIAQLTSDPDMVAAAERRLSERGESIKG